MPKQTGTGQKTPGAGGKDAQPVIPGKGKDGGGGKK